MFENIIHVLYIVFENEETSIFHVFTDYKQGKEMEERMIEHAKKNKLKENFYLVGYELLY